MSWCEIIGPIQIVLQLGAAYYSYKLIKYINHYEFCFFLLVAFLLMAARRVTAFLVSWHGWEAPENIKFIDTMILPLAISCMLCFGLFFSYTSYKNDEQS